MKLLGKISLFFSSYLLLFVILLVNEIGLIQEWKKIPSSSIAILTFYLLLIIFSIISIIIFKKEYSHGTIADRKKIDISSLSSGSSEIMSYLITMVIPLASMGALSSLISLNSWAKLVSMAIIIFFILIIYINSNLIVVNPILILFGYSIHKINFTYNGGSKINFDGILLSKRTLDLKEIKTPMILDEIDKNTFIIRLI